MKWLFLLSLFSLLLQAQNILVVNSNSKVKKYTEAVEQFGLNFSRPYKILDISEKNSRQIRDALYDEYPDIVYTVGAKAYQYANEYIPEKEIYFSSIVDWKRLDLKGTRYGVSNELHSGMQLILIKSVFSNVRTIGIVHSRYTQNIIDNFNNSAAELGIQIVPVRIDDSSLPKDGFDEMMHRCDAIMIVSDPLLLKNEKMVETLFNRSKAYKKPIIAYHELFIQYGAALIISVDNPTIGRQIAGMVESNLNNEKIEKIQYPAGTKVVFNKKEADSLGIEYSPEITSFTTEIVE